MKMDSKELDLACQLGVMHGLVQQIEAEFIELKKYPSTVSLADLQIRLDNIKELAKK